MTTAFQATAFQANAFQIDATPPPVVVTGDTHDGKRLRKRFAEERRFRDRRKNELLNAFERIVEDRPEVAAEIAAPFLEPASAQPSPTANAIDTTAMLASLDRAERIWAEFLDLDDEEVLLLI
jgi:hypothetical protein